MTSKTPLPSDENKAMAAMFKHMAEHGGGPAYPMQMELGKAENGEPFVWFAIGLNKRERLAAMVLQGFCSNPAVFASNPTNGWGLVNCDEQRLVEYCLHIADKMLKTSNEPTKTQNLDQ